MAQSTVGRKTRFTALIKLALLAGKTNGKNSLIMNYLIEYNDCSVGEV